MFCSLIWGVNITVYIRVGERVENCGVYTVVHCTLLYTVEGVYCCTPNTVVYCRGVFMLPRYIPPSLGTALNFREVQA